MKRRPFLGTALGTGALLAGTNSCSRQSETSQNRQPSDTIGKLAGYTLEELRELYRKDLFEEFLPFVDAYVIDHEYGGFICSVDREGVRLKTDKSTWNQGRGIWMLSFLYNNIDPNPKWLEASRKSVDFILKTKPSDDTLWHKQFNRDGTPIGEPDTVVYSDLFVANGLQEFSQAGGEEYWDMAKEIMLKCIDIYDNRPNYGSQYTPGVSRPRSFSHWFQIGRMAMQMLEKRADPEVQAVVDRCIDAVMNAHYNPEFRLMTEYVNHDLSHIDSDYGQNITTHAQEVLWLVMQEAVRKGDRQLFDTAVERFKRHVEVLWDDVYGGLMTLRHVDDNRWNTNKPLWLQVEVLFGTMTLIELTGDQWAKEWFTKMYTWFRDKYYLKKHGLPLWMIGGDRKLTFNPKATRVGIFQQPRHLMLNILALDRIIANGGKTIGVFQ
ncbi:AGE family epimerase/isomerase [Candidatus Latescibacterota bacterium]